MTKSTFDKLNEDDKLKTLINSGRVISERKDLESRSFLYYLGSFYATVQYQIGSDEMTGINAFENISREERIKWKVLRDLPTLLHNTRRFDSLF